MCSVRQLLLCCETQRERGKASLNVGCCVIPPRAPLLFLCLGPHVTVGYFLWWLARINRSSNVHPVSQQLHDWWDFTLLIYFIIVTQTWGEWRNGLCSMRNVTCDCRYGTGDYSNVRFVWGLYLISECQLLYEPRLFSHQTVCFISFWSQQGLLILHAMCYVAVTLPQRVLPSSYSEAGHLLMIFMDLLSAWGFMPVPFNGQLSL